MLEESQPEMAGKTPITVDQLNGLIADMFKTKEEIAEINRGLVLKKKEFSAKKLHLVALLKDLGQKSFRAPSGLISIKQIWHVNNPKDGVDKTAFFDWLRERGIFEQYATVNSRSLNTLYKTEWEIAKKSGEGMDFSIPGLGEPTLREDIHPTRSGETEGEDSE